MDRTDRMWTACGPTARLDWTVMVAALGLARIHKASRGGVVVLWVHFWRPFREVFRSNGPLAAVWCGLPVACCLMGAYMGLLGWPFLGPRLPWPNSVL